MSERTAQLYMQLARSRDRLRDVGQLTIEGAAKMIAAPRADRHQKSKASADPQPKTNTKSLAHLVEPGSATGVQSTIKVEPKIELHAGAATETSMSPTPAAAASGDETGVLHEPRPNAQGPADLQPTESDRVVEGESRPNVISAPDGRAHFPLSAVLSSSGRNASNDADVIRESVDRLTTTANDLVMRLHDFARTDAVCCWLSRKPSDASTTSHAASNVEPRRARNRRIGKTLPN
jgi:hypothetical protein